ncbi:MAG: YciI family protein [Longimicrobiaceae bacterium]
MRFLIIRKADAETEAGAAPTPELLKAMGRYIEELVSAGVMRSGEGLRPSSFGARVKFTEGKPVVVDGPFAETKELVAGFSLYEVGSKEEAIEWVKRWPVEDGGGNVEIEIRPLYELEDLASGETLERYARLQDEMAAP